MPAIGDGDGRIRDRNPGGYEAAIIAINDEFPFLNGHS
jgi:hypothetical protein